MGVNGTTRLQFTGVVPADTIQEAGGVLAFDLVDAHVRDVEQTCGLPRRLVLVEHRTVPDRHLPAGEGDDLGAHLFVDFIERCTAQVALAGFPFEIG